MDLITAAQFKPDFKHPLVVRRCCTGHTINLLEALGKDLKFEMHLYFIRDGLFGALSKYDKDWNGAINHVISGVAHMAAGPFSVNDDRARFIDFSVPFLHSGYALLVKHEKKGIDDLFM